VRVSKVAALHNPVPKSVRKVGGMGVAACEKIEGGGASVLEAESCLERSRRDWLPSRDHASVASQPPTLHPHAQRPRSAHAQPPFSLHMLTRPCASTYIHVQGMLYYPCAGDEFFFTITETFWPDRSGVDHPLTFTTVPPVMASCIKAAGSHWVRYKVS